MSSRPPAGTDNRTERDSAGPRPAARLARLAAQDREIWLLAVPALGALVAEPVFQLADAAIVGHLGLWAGGGLTGLWLAIGAFMISRLVVLSERARTSAWTVTGTRR